MSQAAEEEPRLGEAASGHNSRFFSDEVRSIERAADVNENSQSHNRSKGNISAFLSVIKCDMLCLIREFCAESRSEKCLMSCNLYASREQEVAVTVGRLEANFQTIDLQLLINVHKSSDRISSLRFIVVGSLVS